MRKLKSCGFFCSRTEAKAQKLQHLQHSHLQQRRSIEADTCITVIKQCKSLRCLKSVHASMLRSHLLPSNIYFSTNLISQYASLGSLSLASSLFSSLASPDVFLFNVIIRCFVDNSHFLPSLLLYRHLLQLGLHPDNFTLPFLLKASAFLPLLNLGSQIHAHVLLFGYASDVFVANSLVSLYGRCDCYGVSRRVFDEMPEKNVVSWSAMIGACLHNKLYDEGLSLFWWMLGERIRPSRGSILNAMACVRTEDVADDVCRIALDSGLYLDQCVQTATTRMYARCGRMDVASRLFDGILNKDLVTWASMIKVYTQADMPVKALNLFNQMILQRINPDAITLLSVIQACSALASFQFARSVHGVITRWLFNIK